MIKTTGLLVGLTLLAASCGGATAALETVPAGDAAALVGRPDVVVLDIRTPAEYGEGIIEGAVNIDFYEPDFADRLDALDKSLHYVVYCRSGNRSAQAMPLFDDLGFSSVTEIDGGILSWVGAGLAVTTP